MGVQGVPVRLELYRVVVEAREARAVQPLVSSPFPAPKRRQLKWRLVCSRIFTVVPVRPEPQEPGATSAVAALVEQAVQVARPQLWSWEIPEINYVGQKTWSKVSLVVPELQAEPEPWGRWVPAVKADLPGTEVMHG